MALIYDRTDFEKAENQFEVHNALGKFSCHCNICEKQIRPPDKPIPSTLRSVPVQTRKAIKGLDREKAYKQVGGFERNFLWLLEHLLPPNDMIKGCELIFPDTVFFEKGKAKVIIRMDKEFCLQGNK